MSRRAYDNTFRAEQAEQTRQRLLEAVRDHLAAPEPQPLTMAAIASAAGVSEPTAYRHFPSRDALLEAAAAYYAREYGEPAMPGSASEIPALLVAMADYFGANSQWMRAALRNPNAAEVRASGRKKRIVGIRALLAPRVEHLAPRERELVLAVMLSLIRLETWDFVTQGFGLTDQEAGRAMAWASQALLDALENSRAGLRTQLVDDEVIQLGQSWNLRQASRTSKAAEHAPSARSTRAATKAKARSTTRTTKKKSTATKPKSHKSTGGKR